MTSRVHNEWLSNETVRDPWVKLQRMHVVWRFTHNIMIVLNIWHANVDYTVDAPVHSESHHKGVAMQSFGIFFDDDHWHINIVQWEQDGCNLHDIPERISLNENCLFRFWISQKFVPRSFDNLSINIGSARHQAITWTNDDQVQWRIHLSIYVS